MSAVERLAAAHHNAELLYHGSCGNHTEGYDDHITGHMPCFTEDENEDTRDLIAALELGLAWQAAEAALPDMPSYVTTGGKWRLNIGNDFGRWDAEAYQPVDDDWQAVIASGATPAEALRNLAAMLADAK